MWELLNQKSWDISSLEFEKSYIESELQIDIETLEAWKKYLSQSTWSLNNSMDKKVTFQELSEEEVFTLSEKIKKQQEELARIKDQLEILKIEIKNKEFNKLNPEELVKMSKISNKEFLQSPKEERLKFITVWNINWKDINKDFKNEIEFTFTFNSQFNQDLYQQTTAWQVIKQNIRELNFDWEIYSRKWIDWEFFNTSWKRLTIHEWTKVNITKYAENEELEQMLKSWNEKIDKYKDTPNYELASESFKKWYDIDFVISLFDWKYNNLAPKEKSIQIEQDLTELARLQNDYTETYENKDIWKDKISENFAWYLLNYFDNDNVDEIATKFGFDSQKLKSVKTFERYWWDVNMDNINLEWISKEELDNILNKKNFRPWSKEAIVLFRRACQRANLPLEWCNNEWLHRILQKESNWVVWRLNYTIKWENPESFKEKALSSNSNNPMWVKSTASWLWQLLLSNVDKYYPDGRKWIWDPINEAVWMLRYIKDRYWSPDIAFSVYGKITSYDHPEKWTQKKGFAEWY